MLKRPCMSAIEVGYRYSPLSFLVSFNDVDMDISSLIICLETWSSSSWIYRQFEFDFIDENDG